MLWGHTNEAPLNNPVTPYFPSTCFTILKLDCRSLARILFLVMVSLGQTTSAAVRLAVYAAIHFYFVLHARAFRVSKTPKQAPRYNAVPSRQLLQPLNNNPGPEQQTRPKSYLTVFAVVSADVEMQSRAVSKGYRASLAAHPPATPAAVLDSTERGSTPTNLSLTWLLRNSLGRNLARPMELPFQQPRSPSRTLISRRQSLNP